ncbi:class I SAM-dependent methyltransferase [Pseudoalteromonas piscicida]|uniref:SAM-dependent methyltransferase n=1 Tax=Pseudoalteromonas piscicida TaxID=43662 RepID=A0A2A5JL82_PSEO7|nr:class I SAM-dependent methyltransferase [Pseudoalteromonas piscicida]PCK30188.1 SAM-dependent methyltransferase [Pseudoalteromonas piscicida]
MSEITLAYYSQHAEEFASSTLNVDMQPLYQMFLPELPLREKSQIHILDAGCGSGRDALAFKRLGYEVSAMDACEKLVKIAATQLGQPVRQQYFEEIQDIATFDGIWACASLLHVAEKDLPNVFMKLQEALKLDGVLYVSFKYGAGERVHNGRRFTDLNETGLSNVIAACSDLNVIKQWVTEDRRPNRDNELWLNALLRKG